jgi:hypothetical protein
MLVNRPVTSAPRLPPPGCSTVPRTSSLLLPKHGAKRAMPAALGAGESSWARGEAGHEHWFRRGAAAPVEGRRKTRRPVCSTFHAAASARTHPSCLPQRLLPSRGMQAEETHAMRYEAARIRLHSALLCVAVATVARLPWIMSCSKPALAHGRGWLCATPIDGSSQMAGDGTSASHCRAHCLLDETPPDKYGQQRGRGEQ